jgi:CheY-like chemotaxis protein
MQVPSLSFFSPRTAGFPFSSNILGYTATEYGPRKNPRPYEAAKKRSRSTRRTSGSRVLLFGRIRELALYRAEVLRNRGFAVTIPRDNQEALKTIRHGDFDIAVLSYTLPSDTVQQIAELMREYRPDCPLIAISETGRVDRRVDPDETVIADDGPPALLAALRRVTRES